MKIIDTHTHIFPPKIAEKAVESIGNFYDIKMKNKGSKEELLASGKEIGVEKYLVFSTATKVEQVESINNFIISEISQTPEFIGLGTMYKGYASFDEEFTKLRQAGIKGIKLHPDFQKFDFNDKELFPIFDSLVNHGMFIMTHAGDYRYGYSHPEKIAQIAKEFPKLNIIAAHFGGWSQWDIALEVLNLPNVYFDTSSTMGFSSLDTAKKAFSVYDNTHIFFGTDFPMWNHKDELNNILNLGLDDKTVENVLYNNFNNFYNNMK